MSSVSPPKPYELPGGQSKPLILRSATAPAPALAAAPTTGQPSAVAASASGPIPSPQPTPAPSLSGLHPSDPLSSGGPLNQSTALSSAYPADSLVPRPGLGPGPSPYGSSYSSPSYPSSYSPYGVSSYGGGPGMGYGVGYPGPGPGMMNGPMGLWGKTVAGFETGIQGFGRISQLLQMNFDALHMSFSSLLRLFDHFHLLRHEIGGITTTFSALKLFHYIGQRIRARWMAILGRPVSEAELTSAWDKLRQPQQQPHANHEGSVFGWVPHFFLVAVLWSILRLIFRKIRNAVTPPLTEEEKAKAAKAEEMRQLSQIYQLDKDGKPVVGPDGRPVLQPGVRIGPDGQPIPPVGGALAPSPMGYGMGMSSMGMNGGYSPYSGYGPSAYSGSYGGYSGSFGYGPGYSYGGFSPQFGGY